MSSVHCPASRPNCVGDVAGRGARLGFEDVLRADGTDRLAAVLEDAERPAFLVTGMGLGQRAAARLVGIDEEARQAPAVIDAQTMRRRPESLCCGIRILALKRGLFFL